MSEPLLQTDALARRLGDPKLRIVDATWYLPTEKKDPDAEFLAAHIPGALRFDISTVCDKTHKAPQIGRAHV